MIITTTQSIEGQTIREYKGIVVGEAIMGANIVRDFFASITDVIGGRSGAYEQKLADARQIAEAELADEARARGANAVVGVDLDYEVVGESMLMVSMSGTAAKRMVGRIGVLGQNKTELRALSSSELDLLADYARDELRNHLRAFEG